MPQIENITDEHIQQAIYEMSIHGTTESKRPIENFISYRGILFPLKRTLSVANRIANGEPLPADDSYTTDMAIKYLKEIKTQFKLVRFSDKKI